MPPRGLVNTLLWLVGLNGLFFNCLNFRRFFGIGLGHASLHENTRKDIGLLSLGGDNFSLLLHQVQLQNSLGFLTDQVVFRLPGTTLLVYTDPLDSIERTIFYQFVRQNLTKR